MTATSAGFEERGDTEFLFDFDQYERMDQAGVFDDVFGRVELIEGKIIRMAPASLDHGEISANAAFVLKSAIRKLSASTSLKVFVGSTLKLGRYSAPDPDVLVARAPEGKYAEAEAAVLVVEVSISSLGNDLTVKSRLYAKAGVPEYWVAEPEARRLTVFSQPLPDGGWGETAVHEGDAAAVSPLFAPEVRIPLSELF